MRAEAALTLVSVEERSLVGRSFSFTNCDLLPVSCPMARPSLIHQQRPGLCRFLLALSLLLAQGCAPGPLGLWQSRELQTHPLVGQLYDVQAKAFVPFDRLFEAAQAHAYVLLGEQHDNADHHRMQAWLLRELGARELTPAVVLEQVNRGDEDLLEQALAAHPRDAAGMAAALSWEDSGWPPFRDYRPLFEAALEEGLVLKAGNLSRDEIRTLIGMKPDAEARRRELQQEFAWVPALEGPALERITEDIRESHCGMAHAGMVEAMIEGQAARDAVMARTLVGAKTEFGAAVLIAGFGHTRRDFGVPRLLALLDEEAGVLSLGMLEVRGGAVAVADYAEVFGGSLPFDFVWFTPRVSNDDPCETFRASLERMKSAAPEEP